MAGPRYCELVRVSSVGQADRATPEDQRRALDGLRRSRPGTLVERIDSTVSGARDSDDRADLARLFALLSAGAVDELRVRHVDRVTRHPDPRQRVAVLGALIDAGAVVVETSGRVIDPRDEMGELDLTLQGWMAARERRRIVDRTLAAKQRLAAAGRLVSSTAPWGRAFDRDTGWSLTDAAADYRRLFDLVLQGRTLWQAARALTDEGAVSPRGKPWTAGMVAYLLRAGHASGIYRSHGAESRIPAIVDEATQREALDVLSRHDGAGGAHARHPALLRKLLRCGVCGAPCHTDRHNIGDPLIYVCSARDPACRKAHVVADVDGAVRARLAAWIKARGAPLVGEDPARDPEAEQLELNAAEAGVRKVAAEEARLADLIVRGSLPAGAVAAAERGVRARRAAAERRLDAARMAAASAERRTEALATLGERLDKLRRRLARSGFAEWREVMEHLFSPPYHVSIWPDGHVRLHGAVPLDATGERALSGAGNRPGHSRTPSSIPVVLATYAALRRAR